MIALDTNVLTRAIVKEADADAATLGQQHTGGV
jgi:predicted nucleic-acid-binding protein